MGTGPWQPKDFNSSAGMTFVKNDGWWGAAEARDDFDESWKTVKLVFAAAVPGAAAVRAGDVDGMVGGDGTAFSGSNVELTKAPTETLGYITLLTDKGPLADVHVRRAISYAIDRAAIVKSILFGYGQPANSFLPPQVPFYDKNSPGLQYDIAKAKAEMAKSKYPKGFKVQLLVGAGAQTETATGQVLQQALKQLGITVQFKQEDTSTEFQDIEHRKYQLGFSYWTMDIADPDELVTFAIDPAGGASQFYTGYDNPKVIAASHKAQRNTNPAQRQQLYNEVQTLAANDAFLGFLYYSPFRYAYSSKLHGFFVYPLGNYHLEDAWLG
jgi:peptide/nickel transport system substrate-binding protein